MKRKMIMLLMVVSFFASYNCANDIGESCETAGSSDECSDDGVCGYYGAELQCLKVCAADTDCAANEACNGITSTNTKGCQLKDDSKK
ncbi:MAG: hypothetical protein OEZ22_06165 [Spirochaetia bacterium]|nr:hypothetical protein [Spirochaetia bacterium]